MRKRCSRGNYVVKYGDWVEVFAEGTDVLLASFQVRSDMCQELFDNYLINMHNIDKPYRLKRRKR